MVEEAIRVKIIGDDGSLTKSLGTLTAQLKRFQTGLKDATSIDSFQRVQKAIEATKARIDQLSNSQSNFAKSSATAGQSLTNLSRIAQDAPYGFIGIANNINP